MITGYIIVDSSKVSGLQRAVMNMMELGWQPLGGVAINGDNVWAQAMVKYDDRASTE